MKNEESIGCIVRGKLLAQSWRTNYVQSAKQNPYISFTKGSINPDKNKCIFVINNYLLINECLIIYYVYIYNLFYIFSDLYIIINIIVNQ